MSLTTERDPFLGISEADIIVGSQFGFYPMPDGKLWVSKTVQDHDSMSLAEIINRDKSWQPTIEITVARGGLSASSGAVYYNGASIVPGLQTEQYIDDSDENRRKRPRIVTWPDWDALNDEIERQVNEGRIDEPRVLVRDELSDRRRALQLVKKTAAKKLQIPEISIRTAVLYDKDSPLDDLEDGETCHDDIVKIDYSVRPTPGVWLDHQSQANPVTLIQRQKDLAPYMADMQLAAYFFEKILVPDPELMERVIARSAT